MRGSKGREEWPVCHLMGPRAKAKCVQTRTPGQVCKWGLLRLARGLALANTSHRGFREPIPGVRGRSVSIRCVLCARLCATQLSKMREV